ncbi:MAG: archaemetzincin family Zn-dependent metalloprotease [Proteobacteria bacterium]|nr:archaemetzincin family Zn-dependent metalloprotease [Pseudomonadota bacterium]MCG2739120.1 archaemetzincin family Zn-dependent metalloprotease [Syntrophaceae bacterium]
MSYIYIVPIELEDHSDLGMLESFISETFHLKTRRREFEINLKGVFDPSRGQYNSSLILQQLIMKPPPDADKMLGVLDVDLFIPILTFVFGEAQLKGIGAVVSTQRLQNRFYGLPENREVTRERLLKEAVHELGHTFGLVHCSQSKCVMNSSTYAENIDQKSADLCPLCQKSIKAERNGPVNKRFPFSWWGEK